MKREMWFAPNMMGDSGDPSKDERYRVESAECKGATGNLWSSVIEGQPVDTHPDRVLHAPCLDIDLPCRLVESETPGHFHLFVDHAVEWSTYEDLLCALSDAGILEDGYASASIERRQSFVATGPWKKAAAERAAAKSTAPAAVGERF